MTRPPPASRRTPARRSAPRTPRPTPPAPAPTPTSPTPPATTTTYRSAPTTSKPTSATPAPDQDQQLGGRVPATGIIRPGHLGNHQGARPNCVITAGARPPVPGFWPDPVDPSLLFGNSKAHA